MDRLKYLTVNIASLASVISSPPEASLVYILDFFHFPAWWRRSWVSFFGLIQFYGTHSINAVRSDNLLDSPLYIDPHVNDMVYNPIRCQRG